MPTVEVTTQHLGPMDTVTILLADEARHELAKLRREYAITFADKDGGKFVFQRRLPTEPFEGSECKFNLQVFSQSTGH